MTDKVISSIQETILPVSKIINLPEEQGIYAFFLNKTAKLNELDVHGRLIYVGLAEKNLYGRDTLSHLAAGKTGWSSFRRSLGAILKRELDLTAVKRDKNSVKLRADKFKFTDEGETKLTEWMLENLEMGYWVNKKPFTRDKLRALEEKVIIKLKPTLDLDRRTRNLNSCAEILDNYRKVCRNEVKEKFK